MRRVALLLALSFAISPAWAGKVAVEKAAEDPYAYPTMEITSIPSIDAVFSESTGPIERVIDARKQVDQARAQLAGALQVAEGTPVKDALVSLQAKAEGKLGRVVQTGKLPRVQATAMVPENVQTAIDAINASLDELDTALVELRHIQPEIAQLVTKTSTMAAEIPELAKAEGVAPTKIPASLGATKKNATTLKGASEECQRLIASIEAIHNDVESALAE